MGRVVMLNDYNWLSFSSINVEDWQFESVPKSNKFKNKVKNKKNYSRKSSHKTNSQKRSNRH